MRKAPRLITGLVATAMTWTGLVAPAAHAGPGESTFVARMNAERTARGLGAVEVYWDLVDDARAHSQRMADQGSLHHNPSLGSVTGGWITLGENVGVGPSVDALHAAFMNSSGHRANILGDFNYVGVGVVAESDTMLWVTVVFMKGPEGLVTPPAEDPPPEPPPEEPAPEPGGEDPPAEDPPADDPPAEEAPTPPPPPPSRPRSAAPVAAPATATPEGLHQPVVGCGRPRLAPIAI